MSGKLKKVKLVPSKNRKDLLRREDYEDHSIKDLLDELKHEGNIHNLTAEEEEQVKEALLQILFFLEDLKFD